VYQSKRGGGASVPAASQSTGRRNGDQLESPYKEGGRVANDPKKNGACDHFRASHYVILGDMTVRSRGLLAKQATLVHSGRESGRSISGKRAVIEGSTRRLRKTTGGSFLVAYLL